jgi:hypothetical protein
MRKRPFNLERDPITGLTRAVDYEREYSRNDFSTPLEMIDYIHLGNENDEYRPKLSIGKHSLTEPKKHTIKTKKKKKIKSEPCGTGLIDCYYNPQEEFNGTFKDKDIYSKIQ